jgi:nucleotide-binding universal stress UspA family protein
MSTWLDQTSAKRGISLRSRSASSQILRLARDRNAHLIVVGVHGRNLVDLMLFGSTTQHVVRQATCPVLTLRG